ncbi:lytic transglycosylase domain-containing protein [Jiella sp. MQZ9-1]|uniref:Lytic transglycosylase domain-containing protein n=1 Tax=Jiella flava TaxID=2816857 RepID=A0A939JUJ7_9HYPH|nr:lytic transglycosylase domain-containing protein [Jiella flava]MBO0661027.1 lytic transglycosylase domain-containing protein [Jiella flava]MCD2469675.1 lytic transglycosylase domain-containing protein [Jiella flava]
MAQRPTRSVTRVVGAIGLALAAAFPAGATTPQLGSGDAAITLPALAYPPSPPRFSPPANGADMGSSPTPAKGASEVDRICQLIGDNADAVGMPRSFFARLIWKESRFDAKALSPVGAQGIAQFMPYTAAERGLNDPYDIAQAIHHSALYLADLRSELGNWGLAAAAYNGGINRVKRWMASGGSLPLETENYVLSITAHPADWFTEDDREVEGRPLEEGTGFASACRKLPVMTSRSVFAALKTGAPMKPWGVQVAGNPRSPAAMAMFRRVQSRFPSLLGDKNPLVIRERVPGRGRIFAVRIGADSRAEAEAFCGKLKSAGGSCIVMKNR